MQSKAKRKERDEKGIDLIIEKVKERLPDADFYQLTVINPNDDDGIWWFYLPELEPEVHVESSYGMCPFIIETDEQWGRDAVETDTVDETVKFIVEYLESKRKE